ncbi:hypothetical protein [Umezawaea sp. Da 62-37]|uniref:hypothetical protein n=1 Tax=Umezawaea sp. Da 62-37 TaxID=3075927 RepID=UPI0028F6FBF2|nr:hypothetical protein [Umezawaea sp. Da 62-37]WNV89020.1 hypothetical protein RM788_12175 [Umezawaea sp. Da 62-37]
MITTHGNGAPRQESAAQEIASTSTHATTPVPRSEVGKASDMVEVCVPIDAVYEYSRGDFYQGAQRLHPDGALVRINIGRLDLPYDYLSYGEREAAAALCRGASRVQVVGHGGIVAELVEHIRQRLVEMARANVEADQARSEELAEWERIRAHFAAEGDVERASWWAQRLAEAEFGGAA